MKWRNFQLQWSILSSWYEKWTNYLQDFSSNNPKTDLNTGSYPKNWLKCPNGYSDSARVLFVYPARFPGPAHQVFITNFEHISECWTRVSIQTSSTYLSRSNREWKWWSKLPQFPNLICTFGYKYIRRIRHTVTWYARFAVTIEARFFFIAKIITNV